MRIENSKTNLKYPMKIIQLQEEEKCEQSRKTPHCINKNNQPSNHNIDICKRFRLNK